jgi:hypothetical protein
MELVTAHERKEIGGISPIDNVHHLGYDCNCHGAYESRNPDNSLFVKVPAFVRLGSFLQMPFSKRWRASRDAVLLFLRAALGAYPGGNTRPSRKTGACMGSTCMGISVTGQVLGT